MLRKGSLPQARFRRIAAAAFEAFGVTDDRGHDVIARVEPRLGRPTFPQLTAALRAVRKKGVPSCSHVAPSWPHRPSCRAPPPAGLRQGPARRSGLPAVHRFKVGAFEVTGLSDGTMPLGLELFRQPRRSPTRRRGSSPNPPSRPARSGASSTRIWSTRATGSSWSIPAPARTSPSGRISASCRGTSKPPASTRRPSTLS